MIQASKAYGINIAYPNWVKMNDNLYNSDWIKKAEEYFPKNGKNKVDFVVFFVSNGNYSLYSKLKKHSICNNGYVSQVVRDKNFDIHKNYNLKLSICSKILLQLNAKLGGINYKIKLDDNIIKQKLMIIGIDFSHIQGKRTCVSMVATINGSFTDFYNKEDIIIEENKIQLQFCLSSFIEEAIPKYKD